MLPGLWWLHGIVETQAPSLLPCHLMTTLLVPMLSRWRLECRPARLHSRQEEVGMDERQEKENDRESPPATCCLGKAIG